MSSATIKRVRIRVQGVFTRAKASALGLPGWVRNTPDGAVELHAQGSEAAVAELFAWCHHGPPHAVVRDVSLQTEPLLSYEQDFEMHH